MKISKREGVSERRILIGMITDRTVLAAVASKWDTKEEGLFNSKWANLVGSWAVTFFRTYDKPPKSDIQGLFESWCDKTKDQDTIEIIEKFLSSLSDEYEKDSQENSSEYIIDLATRYFSQIAMERLALQITGDIDSGRPEEAEKKIAQFNKIEVGMDSSIDVLRDEEAMKGFCESKRENLIDYPGALGRFFGMSLERDGFICFQAPIKTAKSFWIFDMAYRAVKQRRRTAVFQVGDLSRNQMLGRIYTRLAKRPLGAQEIDIPISIKKEDGRPFVETKKVKYDKAINFVEIKAATEKLINRTRSNDTLLRLSVHPNFSLSIDGLRAIVQGWENKGWVPDVVCIDYLDLLAPLPGYKESRHEIDATWRKVRALSQSLHCLVVSATQANAASFSSDLITRSHFSEDKRKLAHVTGMIGINMTEEDKEAGLMRLNWIALREDKFRERKVVYTASCLGLANPCVLSTW